MSEASREQPRAAARGLAVSLVGLMGILGATHALAQQQAEDAPHPQEVLRAMADFLHGSEHLSFHGELNFDQVASWGQKIQLVGAGDMWISRPNRMYADFRDDIAARKFWYDGKQITLLDPSSGFYGQEAAPPELDDMVDQTERDLGIRLPLAQLMTAGPYKEFQNRIKRARYLGIHDVDGIACHHLALQGDTVDLQVWVELGDKPVPRKFVIDYKDVSGTPRYMIVLMDWDFTAPKPDLYTPKLPKDATKLEFLGMSAKGGAR